MRERPLRELTESAAEYPECPHAAEPHVQCKLSREGKSIVARVQLVRPCNVTSPSVMREVASCRTCAVVAKKSEK